MTKRLLMILTLACVLPTAGCVWWGPHHHDHGYYGPPGRGPGPGYYH